MTVHNSMGVVGKDGAGAAIPIVTPSNVRAGLSGLVRRRTNSTRPQTGKLKGGLGANLRVAAGAGWTYTVEPGAVVIGAGPTRGADIVVSDSIVTLTTDQAPSSGQSRIDVVYVVQADAFDSSNDATAAIIGLAKGTPATNNPATPSLPPNAQVLATNVMLSSATSTSSTGNTITNVMGYTSLATGIGQYGTLAEMQADDSRDRGVVGFLDADGHLYLKQNSGQGSAATEAPVALWDDLPRVRSTARINHSDSGSIRSGSSGVLTYLSSSFTVPAGRRGTLRAKLRMAMYGGSGANYAGNLFVTIDGVDVQPTRYHNQGRSGWFTVDVTELGYDLSPGAHTIALRQSIESPSSSFEAWYVRGEIIAEW